MDGKTISQANIKNKSIGNGIKTTREKKSSIIKETKRSHLESWNVRKIRKTEDM